MKRFLALLLLALGPLVFAAPAVARTVVLFDEGHGQQFLSGRSGDLDLSSLAGILQKAGCEVRSSRGTIDAAALKDVSALVISGAFAPIIPPEIAAIRQFVVSGGRLAVMLHIVPPVQSLLEELGLLYSRSPVRESAGAINGSSLDFAVTRFEPHALTEGLARLSVFGCWALKNVTNSTARVIARTGPQAWLAANRDGARAPDDPVGVLALVVAGELGAGSYVVFGDDAIFQNRFLVKYNADIGLRLAHWLASASAAGTFATPEACGQDRPLTGDVGCGRGRKAGRPAARDGRRPRVSKRGILIPRKGEFAICFRGESLCGQWPVCSFRTLPPRRPKSIRCQGCAAKAFPGLPSNQTSGRSTSSAALMYQWRASRAIHHAMKR